MSLMNRDLWLNRWLQLVRERAEQTSVLELGCGRGQDTATLVEAGLPVIAIDLSPSEIEHARALVPGADYFVQDVRAPFPASTNHVGVVVASLSLHYFTWIETIDLVARIHSALQPNGILLCRLNSTKDHNFGAAGYPEIEKNFYLVEGKPKRFFNRAAVDALFSQGWQTLSLEEHVVERHFKPKVVWEIILQRGA